MMLQQCEAVGLLPWLARWSPEDFDAEHLSMEAIAECWDRQVAAAGRYQHVVAFVFGSDQGADETAADNLINNDFTSNVFLWKIR